MYSSTRVRCIIFQLIAAPSTAGSVFVIPQLSRWRVETNAHRSLSLTRVVYFTLLTFLIPPASNECVLRSSRQRLSSIDSRKLRHASPLIFIARGTPRRFDLLCMWGALAPSCFFSMCADLVPLCWWLWYYLHWIALVTLVVLFPLSSFLMWRCISTRILYALLTYDLSSLNPSLALSGLYTEMRRPFPSSAS